MTIVVEDGTGKADAESYCDVAYADNYHSKRNNTSWAPLTTALKEAFLRNATEFMIGLYRMRWLGRRVLTTQALDWPRVGVVIKDFESSGFPGSYGLYQVDYTIVPVEVKNACAELALRASKGELAPDRTQKIISETVGPISVTYDKDAPAQVQYRQVDAMLKVYLQGGGSMMMVKLARR